MKTEINLTLTANEARTLAGAIYVGIKALKLSLKGVGPEGTHARFLINKASKLLEELRSLVPRPVEDLLAIDYQKIKDALEKERDPLPDGWSVEPVDLRLNFVFDDQLQFFIDRSGRINTFRSIPPAAILPAFLKIWEEWVVEDQERGEGCDP